MLGKVEKMLGKKIGVFNFLFFHFVWEMKENERRENYGGQKGYGAKTFISKLRENGSNYPFSMYNIFKKKSQLNIYFYLI